MHLILMKVSFIIGAVLSTSAFASLPPEKVKCTLTKIHSEIKSCQGKLKHFQPVLESGVENPLKLTGQGVVHRNSKFTFHYMKSASSYQDSQRPIYRYKSDKTIDGKPIYLLLVAKENIKLDNKNKNWKKERFYDCKGECPFTTH